MINLLEALMIICFGLSWPVSIRDSTDANGPVLVPALPTMFLWAWLSAQRQMAEEPELRLRKAGSPRIREQTSAGLPRPLILSHILIMRNLQAAPF